jgi:hypothetical protein
MGIGKATIVLLLFLGFMASCSENSTPPAGQTQREQADSVRQDGLSEPQPSHTGREVEIVGVVERFEDGFAIWTLTETFAVEGHDLSDLVGKSVKATGYLIEKKNRPGIQIRAIKEIG